MKNLAFAFLAASAMFVFTSCETTSTAESAPTVSSSGNGSSNTGSSVKSYPLSTCLVTGEGLESKKGSITKVYKGQEVKFCCKPCVMAFNKNPEVFLSKIQ